MKNLIILSFIIAIFCSCKNSNQDSINQIAEEMCAVMEIYNDEDPLSIIEVQTALTELAENVKAYENITQSELEDAMKTICPEGFKKFEKIISKE